MEIKGWIEWLSIYENGFFFFLKLLSSMIIYSSIGATYDHVRSLLTSSISHI